MSLAAKLFVTLSNLGRSLRQNPTTKLVDVYPSTDPNNIIVYGSDGAIYAPPTSQTANASTYSDTYGIGDTTVQTAIDYLALKTLLNGSYNGAAITGAYNGS